ncbi:putative chromosome segregation protein SMC [Spironucleus salmonicida]|uniref:Chromosome segregation protein SMC n=1 Tax=Spironucleus salmonicida TaxID=348837 RepID=V6LYE3_9EUKA|nr:putative chromosome segregation protein SMC [Spironucleus salmonicida]|eukprot:EST49258.1 Putative chromosome segregation protein SMC [Spironucleus salmonicida]
MLQSISIQNFRTYQNMVTLTIPHQFTAILGPNGSGKSNAISAVESVIKNIENESTVELKIGDVVYKKHLDQYFIDEVLLTHSDFLQQLPLIVLPCQNPFEIDIEQEQETPIDINQLKYELQQLTEQILVKRKNYIRLKDQAEKAKQFEQNQKQLQLCEEELYSLEADEYIQQAIQNKKQIKQLEENLKQFPEQNELLSLQAQLQDIDTDILKQQFKTEQIEMKQSELISLRKKFTQLDEGLTKKQLIIQESISRFNHQLQDNELQKVNSISQLKNLQDLADQQNNDTSKLPDTYLPLFHSFNDKFKDDITKRYQIKQELIEYREQIDSYTKRLSKHQENKSDTSQKLEQKQLLLNSLDNQLTTLKSNHNSAQATLETSLKMRQKAQFRASNLSQQIISLSQKLDSIARTQTAQKNVIQQRKIVQILREKFIGFKGIVSDWVKAGNKNHQKALNFACGGLMHAYVVDNFETAIQAVNELKLRKLPVSTFIPLESLKIINNNRPDMLANFVQKKPGYENLFNFVCKNTILSNENPRQLSSQTGMRVVTIDCKMFSPNGVLSANIGNGKSNSKDDLNFIDLDDEKDKLQQQLDTEEQNTVQLSLKIDQLQNQIILDLEVQIKAHEQKVHIAQLDKLKLQDQVDSLSEQIKDYKDKLFKIERGEEVQNELFIRQSELIDKMKLEYFKVIYSQMKISGHEFLKVEKAFQNDEKIDIQKQIIIIEQKIEIINNQDYETDIQRLNRQIQAIQQQLSVNKTENQINNAQIIENDVILQTIANEQLKFKEIQLQLKSQILSKLRLQTTISDQSELLRISIQEEKQSVIYSTTQLTGLIEKIFTKQITLPSNAEAPKLLLEAFIMQPSDPIIFFLETYQLDMHFKTKLKISQAQRIQELKAELLSLNSISLQNIDLNAVDQVKQAQQELIQLQQTHQTLKSSLTTTLKQSNFDNSTAFEKFSNFVAKMEVETDKLYKLFTEGAGSISLTSVAIEKVQILAVPPGDGVRNFDDLSGGEKALIQMCLVLSFVLIRGAKIVFFDEIDANLDSEKAIFVGQKLREIGVQLICITHKMEFSSEAGALCGVVKREGEGTQSFWVWN